MKKLFVNLILATLMLLPVLSTARRSADSNDPGVQVWVGVWSSQDGVHHTVRGHSFIRCDSLLEQATEGHNYVISECHRI